MIKQGWAIIGILLITLIIVSCGDDEKNPDTSQPPVFSATPIDIAYDPSDSSCGDIIFISPVIRPFGIYLGNDEYSAAMEYFTVPGAPVRAVARGIVDTVIENFVEGDYTIRVISLPGSDYMVIYNHVVDVEVLPISSVSPGDTIGKAGNWNDFMSRTSLQITTGEGTSERSYCPIRYGDSVFSARHDYLLYEYNRRGFEPSYDSLCLKSVIAP